jgi:outer membrane protein OmpA-like peptidoglycan-associated protein
MVFSRGMLSVVIVGLGLVSGSLCSAQPKWQTQSAASSAAASDAAMSADEMVNALKKPQRSRSFRNLTVESTTPGQEAKAEKPSLSLVIQFEFDSAKVSAESAELLNNLSTALKSAELSQAKFLVEGHTDAAGTEAYNQRLSASRAAAVRDVLASKGVESKRISTIGKGATQLADPQDPKAAANRRVRIVNLE